uniref:Single-pass membrane and coiled-coil domain-containing protein 4 homolog n=1 Tax=Spodoptera frugiperda TaxID=7108 RepID=A0A2H1VXB7_SPOFR
MKQTILASMVSTIMRKLKGAVKETARQKRERKQEFAKMRQQIHTVVLPTFADTNTLFTKVARKTATPCTAATGAGTPDDEYIDAMNAPPAPRRVCTASTAPLYAT